MSRIHWISTTDAPDSFPPVEKAFTNPDGLLAAGGDLTPERLLSAYRLGIFPWYNDGQPILWWSPDPRNVIVPQHIHRSRSLMKHIRRSQPRVSLNCAFNRVVDECAAPRGHFGGTWITAEMQSAYRQLHNLGHAHSVEVWAGETLAGGIYGVAIGGMFFGESMFSRQTNGSKIALIYLAKHLESWDFALIDCQMATAHLQSLGSIELPRQQFVETVDEHCRRAMPSHVWARRDNLEL